MFVAKSFFQQVGFPRYSTLFLPNEYTISVGTFMTPEILENSGIGDSSLLKQQGMECLVDLPGVGNNLR